MLREPILQCDLCGALYRRDVGCSGSALRLASRRVGWGFRVMRSRRYDLCPEHTRWTLDEIVRFTREREPELPQHEC